MLAKRRDAFSSNRSATSAGVRRPPSYCAGPRREPPTAERFRAIATAVIVARCRGTAPVESLNAPPPWSRDRVYEDAQMTGVPPLRLWR